MSEEEKLSLYNKILTTNNVEITGLNKAQLKKEIIKLAIKEYLDTNKTARSVKATSAKYGINQKTLSKYLHLQGVDIKNNGGSKGFKYDIFHTIDTEEKAYWLGFLYADGFITSKNNKIGLTLALKDKDHLQKFTDFVDFRGGMNITEDHQFGSDSHFNAKGEHMYKISTVISNVDMWNDLYEKGCVPNKSLILEFPKLDIFSSEDLVIPFIRGYFDGDGTLGLYPHSNENKTLGESLMIVGTKPFLEGVEKYLGKGYLMQKSNCNLLTYRLGYSTKKAFTAADIMYKNANIYLQRKYDIYINEFVPHRKLSKIGED